MPTDYVNVPDEHDNPQLSKLLGLVCWELQVDPAQFFDPTSPIRKDRFLVGKIIYYMRNWYHKETCSVAEIAKWSDIPRSNLRDCLQVFIETRSNEMCYVKRKRDGKLVGIPIVNLERNQNNEVMIISTMGRRMCKPHSVIISKDGTPTGERKDFLKSMFLDSDFDPLGIR